MIQSKNTKNERKKLLRYKKRKRADSKHTNCLHAFWFFVEQGREKEVENDGKVTA